MSQPQGSDAWITYHHADADWVEAIAQRLGDADLTVFYEAGEPRRSTLGRDHRGERARQDQPGALPRPPGA